MSAPPDPVAAASTRLGQLQRGSGEGVRAALAGGAGAVDDLLRCVVDDPRHDRQLEVRERAYAELLVALDAPVEPIARALRGADDALGHGVLAGAFALGHPGCRRLCADRRSDEALRAGVARVLVAEEWARPVELPAALQPFALEELLVHADCRAVAPGLRRRRGGGALGGRSLEELLELGRAPDGPGRQAVLRELCLRDSEEERAALADCVANDLVYARVRLAARALGSMGDERLVELAVEHFAREDVFEDPARRLPGDARMRRSALADYVAHLPEACQRAMARSFYERGGGGYFVTVAGTLMAASATADERELLEAFVVERLGRDSGFGYISELDALARLGDARSAPLLLEVVRQAWYSHARRRALHGLALLERRPPAAAAALTSALWDCEDEAAADGCAFAPALDAAARGRCAELAASPLVDDELARRARRRLRRRMGGAAS